MALTRRKFIKTIGGTGIVLGAGAVGLTQCDRMPAEAIAGWQGPGTGRTDPREWALAHALLAPNPHNMQPWIADLREPDAVTLLVDPDRLLVETDPYGRQILIGHGTFLELFDLAAREVGYRSEITLFPAGSAPPEAGAEAIATHPVAHIRLVRDTGVETSPLFQHIFTRRSCKEPFADQPLTAADAEALRSGHKDTAIDLGIVREGAGAERLKNLTRDAMLLELQTPRTLKESIDVVRVGADEIAEHRDGIELHGPFFWWLKTLGLMTPEKSMTPGTMAYQGGIDYALGWAEATRSFGWITTRDNSRASQVQSGRAYVRLNLAATANGIAMHPVSQLLQEYPEMADLQRAFLTEIGPPAGHTVQMLFRLGYADRPAPSPRRPLDAILRT